MTDNTLTPVDGVPDFGDHADTGIAPLNDYLQSITPPADTPAAVHTTGGDAMPISGNARVLADHSNPLAARIGAAVLTEGTNAAQGAYNAGQDIYNLAQKPHDALMGQIDPTSPDTINSAARAASYLVAPAVGGMPEADTLGIFAGAKSKTADLGALARAQEMATNGASKTDIWNNTGWFTGADKQWRYEIPDNNAKISPEFKSLLQKEESTQKMGYSHHDETTAESQYIYHHPELYAAYPELKNLPMAASYDYQRPATGYFKTENGYPEEIGMRLNEINPVTMLKATMNNGSVAEVGTHEMQHAVQNLEDFSPGGSDIPWIPPHNPDDLNDKYQAYHNAFDAYNHISGEVEARNAVERREWSPEMRRVVPPWESQDFPNDKQIIYAPLEKTLTPVEHDPFGDGEGD